MAYNRPEKVAVAIKRKVSEIILIELKDPRIGFVTVTEVKVSRDLRNVKIFFSVLGDEKQKKSAIIGLERATSYVRRIIGKEMGFRFTPEIIFRYDETYEYSQRVTELLNKVKTEEEERKSETDNEDS